MLRFGVLKAAMLFSAFSLAELTGQVAEQQSDRNPIGLFLSPVDDGQSLEVSSFLIAPCVQNYSATLVLQAYDGVGWQNIDYRVANMGNLDTLQAGSYRLKGRRVLGKFTNLPKMTKEVGKGLVLRVRLDQQQVGSNPNSGCIVGTEAHPFVHIESPVYNWGDPEKYPNFERTNWLQFAGAVNGKLYFFASKKFILFQNAGTDYVRLIEVSPMFGRAEVSIDFFRRDIAINIYFVENNGNSWSGTPPIWVSDENK